MCIRLPEMANFERETASVEDVVNAFAGSGWIACVDEVEAAARLLLRDGVACVEHDDRILWPPVAECGSGKKLVASEPMPGSSKARRMFELLSIARNYLILRGKPLQPADKKSKLDPGTEAAAKRRLADLRAKRKAAVRTIEKAHKTMSRWNKPRSKYHIAARNALEAATWEVAALDGDIPQLEKKIEEAKRCAAARERSGACKTVIEQVEYAGKNARKRLPVEKAGPWPDNETLQRILGAKLLDNIARRGELLGSPSPFPRGSYPSGWETWEPKSPKQRADFRKLWWRFMFETLEKAAAASRAGDRIGDEVGSRLAGSWRGWRDGETATQVFYATQAGGWVPAVVKKLDIPDDLTFSGFHRT